MRETTQFHELFFGTWLSYAFLVWTWECALKTSLDEWIFVFITLMGSSAFLINHFFAHESYWLWLINGYSVVFMLLYYNVAVMPIRNRSTEWKTLAAFTCIPFSIAYIGFEQIARFIVRAGCHEFWVMLVSYLGFVWLILWRAKVLDARLRGISPPSTTTRKGPVTTKRSIDPQTLSSIINENISPSSGQSLGNAPPSIGSSQHTTSATTNRPQAPERNVVLIVGGTGSLGRLVVSELQKCRIPLRVVGRSRESYVNACLTANENLDLVVYDDVANMRDDWFVDVKCIVCVARPRWAKSLDRDAFVPLIRNLSDAACRNAVPNMLLLGLPYVDSFVFGLTPTMITLKAAEVCARDIFGAENSDGKRSSLSIARITEMSEPGHLQEIASLTHLWICMKGYNPRMQPISASDFAKFVAQLAQGDIQWKSELLLGGPQVISWRGLGQLVEDTLGKHLFVISMPLLVVKALVYALDYIGVVLPFFDGVANVLKIMSIPMTANATSTYHESFGEDRVEEYLREHAKPGKAKDVRQRVFGPQ